MQVLETYLGADQRYNRRVNLNAPQGNTVTHAILSVKLDNLPEVMRESVVEGKVPFGRLLRLHVNDRRVRVGSFWKVSCASEDSIGGEHKASTYARTVVIECNGLDAAEVLEIIVL